MLRTLVRETPSVECEGARVTNEMKVLYNQAADIRRQTDTLDIGGPSAKRQCREASLAHNQEQESGTIEEEKHCTRYREVCALNPSRIVNFEFFPGHSVLIYDGDDGCWLVGTVMAIDGGYVDVGYTHPCNKNQLCQERFAMWIIHTWSIWIARGKRILQKPKDEDMLRTLVRETPSVECEGARVTNEMKVHCRWLQYMGK
jgi:hypothetical protein